MQGQGCSLHLSQKFGLLYGGTRSPTIFSKESAVGLILASGERSRDVCHSQRVDGHRRHPVIRSHATLPAQKLLRHG